MVYNTAVMSNEGFIAEGAAGKQAGSLPGARILLLAAVGFTAAYLRIALARVFYPYALDLVEEGMLMQAWRVAARQPVFVPPNADFVPQVYMPLYTRLGGLLLRITGPDFWPLRLLSLAATLVTAVLIYCIGVREAKDKLVALASAALFLAGYRLVGGWYDLARVDALFVALTLAGMAAAVYGHRSNRGLALAGWLMGLSLLTKQNGLFLAAVVGGYVLLAAGRRLWVYAAAFLLTTAVPLLSLEWSSGGWFSYYVIDIAYASPLTPGRVWHTLSREFAGGMGFLVLGSVGTAVLSWRHGWRWFLNPPWLLFIGAAAFVSVAGRASAGGNFNNLIPGYALLCLTPSLLAGQLRRQPFPRPRRVYGLIVAGILGQFLLTIFNPIPYKPARFIPTAAMRASGDWLVRELTAVDGDVLVLMHPSYALKAGKETAVHIQTLWHARRRGQDPLPEDFVRRIERQHYTLILSDESDYFEKDPALIVLLAAHYRQTRILEEGESPPTLSGPVVRPLVVYAPIGSGY